MADSSARCAPVSDLAHQEPKIVTSLCRFVVCTVAACAIVASSGCDRASDEQRAPAGNALSALNKAAIAALEEHGWRAPVKDAVVLRPLVSDGTGETCYLGIPRSSGVGPLDAGACTLKPILDEQGVPVRAHERYTLYSFALDAETKRTFFVKLDFAGQGSGETQTSFDELPKILGLDQGQFEIEAVPAVDPETEERLQGRVWRRKSEPEVGQVERLVARPAQRDGGMVESVTLYIRSEEG